MKFSLKVIPVFLILTFSGYFIIPFFPLISDNDSQSFDTEVVNAFPALTFNQPVDIQSPDDGTNRIFVVEQNGEIWVFDNDESVQSKSQFLSIASKIKSGGEQGLLGLAFHPDFMNNGYFFVDYTSTSGGTVIARYQVSTDDPNLAYNNSELIILEVDQPYQNHNGGAILFGLDNLLYITLGDGGAAFDPDENGQDRTTLLGTILRINVDDASNTQNYVIPTDNPYFGNSEGFREEIYAYGFRNPWKMTLDKVTGDIWIGDVGQNKYEEIDLLKKGKNYGWDVVEGFHCVSIFGCDQTPYEPPITEYNHDLGLAVIGGYLIRNDFSKFKGLYIFADYASGRIWTINPQINQPTNILIQNADFFITSFGLSENQELFFTGIEDGGIGRIYKLQ